MSYELMEIIKAKLIYTARCYRHCRGPAAFTPLLEEGDRLVGFYSCPQRFVSRIVYFSREPDLSWFKEFLANRIEGMKPRDTDLRLATRHGWELGLEGVPLEGEGLEPYLVREVYWSVSRDARSLAFFCPNCKRIFVQSADEEGRCPSCKSQV